MNRREITKKGLVGLAAITGLANVRNAYAENTSQNFSDFSKLAVPDQDLAIFYMSSEELKREEDKLRTRIDYTTYVDEDGFHFSMFSFSDAPEMNPHLVLSVITPDNAEFYSHRFWVIDPSWSRGRALDVAWDNFGKYINATYCALSNDFRLHDEVDMETMQWVPGPWADMQTKILFYYLTT